MSEQSESDIERHSIVDRLWRARQLRGRSIRSLQKALEMKGTPGGSYASVHAYVTGKTRPRRDWLLAASEVLGVRFEWLADAEGEMTVEEELYGREHQLAPELTDALGEALEMQRLLGNVLAGFGLPHEVRQAVFGYLWRRFDLRGRAQELDAATAEADFEARRIATLDHLQDEIEGFVAKKLGPALQAGRRSPSEYAAALFAQLSVLYLTEPPERLSEVPSAV